MNDKWYKTHQNDIKQNKGQQNGTIQNDISRIRQQNDIMLNKRQQNGISVTKLHQMALSRMAINQQRKM